MGDNGSESKTREDDPKSPPSVSLKEFLESVPPSQLRHVTDALKRDGKGDNWLCIPELELHCDACGGVRVFRSESGNLPYVGQRGVVDDVFSRYLCSNCRSERKHYSVAVILTNTIPEADLYKYGEYPPFGQPTPTRLLRLLGDQRELFLKGRRCEFQGLGIGAFSYYRRVVEHQKASIFDEIIKAAKRLNAAKESLEALAAARDETQFSKSVALVKDAIPPALLVHGHNPLTLLHSALSEGLHDRTDEHCLELAQEIRVVLADLAERISLALKDHAELTAAVTRLLTRERKQEN